MDITAGFLHRLFKEMYGLSPHLSNLYQFDLLLKMLDPNPNVRITAADALHHPWFKDKVGGIDI